MVQSEYSKLCPINNFIQLFTQYRHQRNHTHSATCRGRPTVVSLLWYVLCNEVLGVHQRNACSVYRYLPMLSCSAAPWHCLHRSSSLFPRHKMHDTMYLATNWPMACSCKDCYVHGRSWTTLVLAMGGNDIHHPPPKSSGLWRLQQLRNCGNNS